jgi:hypothetical protein
MTIPVLPSAARAISPLATLFSATLTETREIAKSLTCQPMRPDRISLGKRLHEPQANPSTPKRFHHIVVAEHVLLKGTVRRNARLLASIQVNALRSELKTTQAWTPAHRALLSQIKTLQQEAASKIQRAFRQARQKPPLSPAQKIAIQQNCQAARAQEKLVMNDYALSETETMAEGFTLNSNNLIPKNLERTVVDQQNDPVLARFILKTQKRLEEVLKHQAGALAQTRKTSDSEIHSAHEFLFLNKLLELVRKPYRHLPTANEFTELFNQLPRVAPYVNPTFNEYGPKIPLGATIEAGAGVCRHKALLTKKVIDALDATHGIRASLNLGFIPTTGLPVRNAQNEVTGWTTERRGGHAWNHIHFKKTGHEYMFDPQVNLFDNLSDPKQQKWAAVFYRPAK